MKNCFEVVKQGLARLLERKGKEFVLFELTQNCWGEAGDTKVSVSLEHQGWNRAVRVRRLGQESRSVLKTEIGRGAEMPP